jgi:hypothetical protein
MGVPRQNGGSLFKQQKAECNSTSPQIKKMGQISLPSCSAQLFDH